MDEQTACSALNPLLQPLGYSCLLPNIEGAFKKSMHPYARHEKVIQQAGILTNLGQLTSHTIVTSPRSGTHVIARHMPMRRSV